MSSLRLPPAAAGFSTVFDVTVRQLPLNEQDARVREALLRDGIHAAIHLFRVMQQSDVRPATTTYNVFILHCVKQHDPRAAAQWLRDMLQAGLEPDTFTLSCMLVAAANQRAGAP